MQYICRIVNSTKGSHELFLPASSTAATTSSAPAIVSVMTPFATLIALVIGIKTTSLSRRPWPSVPWLGARLARRDFYPHTHTTQIAARNNYNMYVKTRHNYDKRIHCIVYICISVTSTRSWIPIRLWLYTYDTKWPIAIQSTLLQILVGGWCLYM